MGLILLVTFSARPATAQNAETPVAALSNTPLTTSTEIRALPPEEARKNYPVRLVGTILSKQIPTGAGMFVSDGVQAAWVNWPGSDPSQLEVGDQVIVDGVTDPGGFSTIVSAKTIQRVGKGVIPTPIPIQLEHLPDISLEARWIEIRGTVRSCRSMNPNDVANGSQGSKGGPLPTVDKLKHFSLIELSNGNIAVTLKIDAELDSKRYDDAEIIVRGICVNQHNSTRQFVRQFIVVPGEAFIEINQPPPEKPFSVRLFKVARLFQYYDSHATAHRVRVHGTIIHHAGTGAVWIRDGNRGLLAKGTFPDNLKPGGVVEIIGFPAIENFAPVLNNARLQIIREGPPPKPIPLANRNDAAPLESDLISIQAKLVSQRPTASGTSFLLDWHGEPLSASIETSGDPWPSGLLPGATVQATGILTVNAGATPTIDGMWNPKEFQLLLRSPADISIVKPAPWWTLERVVWFLGITAGTLVLAIGGISVTARRRLHEQAQQRSQSEAEFTAVLKERNRLAREMHDTLAQSLNAVSMQLELVRSTQSTDMPKATRHLTAAHRIVRSALAETRDSIWNMRSQVLEKADLGSALESVMIQLVADLGIEARFQSAGRSRRLPPRIENHLLRIGQEAVTNAVKYARPTKIIVRLEFDRSRVTLTVTDNGTGFDVSAPPKHTTSFGLVGMRERTNQMNGVISIESHLNQGTTIAVAVEVPV